jgi:hypothetical protein
MEPAFLEFWQGYRGSRPPDLDHSQKALADRSFDVLPADLPALAFTNIDHSSVVASVETSTPLR